MRRLPKNSLGTSLEIFPKLFRTLPICETASVGDGRHQEEDALFGAGHRGGHGQGGRLRGGEEQGQRRSGQVRGANQVRRFP